jgi:Leucine-rich repeat (LRR) protein
MLKGKTGRMIIMILLQAVFLSATCTKSDNVQDTETKIENILPEVAPIIGGYVFEQYTKERIKNLESFFLEIGPERCADLEGISQLENIRSLCLSIQTNDFYYFSPLFQLSKLDTLGIYGSLKEIPDLSGIPVLKGVLFEGFSLSSMEGLEKMPHLTYVAISRNKIPVTDTTALLHLKNLEHLTFEYGTYNINLYDLRVLSGLEELKFMSCGTIDLSGIGALQSLKKLSLYSNWMRIPNERSVYLHLEEISALTGLREIVIDESINSIEFLASNSNLESIMLFADEEREDYGNPNRFLPLDVSPLRNLTKLSYFSSRGFALKNVDALEGVEQVLIDHSR